MTKQNQLAPAILAPEAGVDPRAYNHVVANAELVTIQLRRHDFDVAAEFYDPAAKKKLKFNRECLACTFDAESSAVAGTFRFGIVGKAARKAVLKSTADYLVIYQFEQSVSDLAAEAFCQRIGLYAAYPYYRALVSSLSAAANLDLPTLPMIATKGSPLPVPQTAAKEGVVENAE